MFVCSTYNGGQVVINIDHIRAVVGVRQNGKLLPESILVCCGNDQEFQLDETMDSFLQKIMSPGNYSYYLDQKRKAEYAKSN